MLFFVVRFARWSQPISTRPLAQQKGKHPLTRGGQNYPLKFHHKSCSIHTSPNPPERPGDASGVDPLIGSAAGWLRSPARKTRAASIPPRNGPRPCAGGLPVGHTLWRTCAPAPFPRALPTCKFLSSETHDIATTKLSDAAPNSNPKQRTNLRRRVASQVTRKELCRQKRVLTTKVDLRSRLRDVPGAHEHASPSSLDLQYRRSLREMVSRPIPSHGVRWLHSLGNRHHSPTIPRIARPSSLP
jgi:hypothetical protein